MKAPITGTNNIKAKAPSKEKSGLVVRLPVKKIYCTKCQKLVRGKAEKSGNSTQINCLKCGQNLWSRSNTSWRGTGNAADSSKQPSK